MIRARAARGRDHLVLAFLAYVPLLLTDPGRVSADTKSYLYLDPGRLLERAPSMWDPHVGLGTVTHQTLGYLFPMGPWFWVMERIGAPDWVAQRLWLGTLVFAAGLGVRFLGRVLGLDPRAVLPAAVVYAVSPYVLHYAARISVILMPWAGLPWMLALTVLAIRRGGWRWPAALALVVALVGAVNATALLLAGLAPLLWVVHVLLERAAPWRRVAAAVARIGVLCLGVSLWWMAGLRVQGAYGVEILRYTETYETVATASSAPELLRGLGYWFFYGGDRVSAWVGPAGPYMTSVPLLLLGFGLLAFSLTALAVAPLPQRRFVWKLLIGGTAVAVGAHPLSSPSPYGTVFESFVGTTAGFALRSTPRAAPLLLLALAVAFGAGVAHVAARAERHRPVAGRVVVAGAVVLAVLQVPSLLTGSLLTSSLQRDEAVPEAWQRAAAAIDAGDPATRVYELPGADFAYYRWGGTIDPITPGLVDRPYVARELIPYGGDATADLLNALEGRLQVGAFEPDSLVPIARLMAVGTVAVRNDLEFERFLLVRPKALWPLVSAAFADGALRAFGEGVPNEPDPRFPLLDEIALNVAPDAPEPPQVGLFDVPEAEPMERVLPAGGATIVAGDGEGLVDLAAAGLLDPERLVLYGPDADRDPERFAALLDGGATLVVTDSHRRAGRRWSSVSANVGYTEQAGEEPLEHDPRDNRLTLAEDEDDGDRTVAVLSGVADVRASGYGNPVTYTPEDRPANALDGDPLTAWRSGAFEAVRGERIRIVLEAPVTTDHVTLLQPLTGNRSRFATSVRLRFDDGDAVDVALDERSRTEPGQEVPIEPRPFRVLEIEVTGDNIGVLPTYSSLPGVGFAEVGIPGVQVDEVLRLPTSLLEAAGDRAATQDLTVVMSRDRIDPATPNRTDPQLHLARRLDLPAARTFELSGTARLSGVAPDAALDAALEPVGEITATSSDRLAGDPRFRGASAIDGDATTAWTTPLRDVVGQSLVLASPTPLRLDAFQLEVVADGRHSVPRRLTVRAEDGTEVTVAVPEVADLPEPGATARVPVLLPAPVTGNRIEIRIDAVREVTSPDYFSGTPNLLPVGIAELGAVTIPAPSGPLERTCRDDLVTLDGEPVPVRLVGDAGDAAARQPIRIEGCSPVTIEAGSRVLRTAIGRDLGIDVDRLVLRSAGPAPSVPAAPPLTVVDRGSTEIRLRVGASEQPSWLVLGQSRNDGWTATAAGEDLGTPLLVNGYANGWLLPAAAGEREVVLRWTPQRSVDLAIGLSAGALLLVLGILAVSTWRARRAGPMPAPATAPATARSPLAVRLAATVGVVLVAAGPLPALAAAAVATIAVRRPSWRRWAAAVPALAVAAVAGIVAVKQLRYDLPAGLEWTGAFPYTNTLAWVAAGAAAVLAVVSAASDATAAPGGAAAP